MTFKSQGFALGIDVGGTKIAGGLVSLADGSVLLHRRIPTHAARGGSESFQDLCALVRGLRDEAMTLGHAPAVCGVGLPEIVTKDGTIVSNAILGWQHLGAPEALSRILPTRLDADVRSAALAEAHWGAGRGLSQFLYVTVGTGISACLVIDGRPYVGSQGLTGTMASNPMFSNDADDRPMRGATLENYAAGPALLYRFQKRFPGLASSTPEVLALASQGHKGAHEIVQSGAELLGYSIGHLVNTLDPAAVVIGGGLGLAGGLYAETLQSATRMQIWSDLHRNVPIIPATTGNHAGILGSALHAAQTSAS